MSHYGTPVYRHCGPAERLWAPRGAGTAGGRTCWSIRWGAWCGTELRMAGVHVEYYTGAGHNTPLLLMANESGGGVSRLNGI